MIEEAAMPVAKKEAPARVSVSLPPEIYAEISARAEEKDMSLNRIIVQLLRAGLEAEHQKKEHLSEMLRRYRESDDAQEAERLGDQLGVMIFGR